MNEPDLSRPIIRLREVSRFYGSTGDGGIAGEAARARGVGPGREGLAGRGAAAAGGNGNGNDNGASVGGPAIRALDRLTLDIARHEFAAITGPSGCGKSTLLHLLGGLDTPSAGELFVGGLALHSADEKALTQYRRHDLGIVFQFFNLLPTMSALENVVCRCCWQANRWCGCAPARWTCWTWWVGAARGAFRASAQRRGNAAHGNCARVDP